MTTRLYGKDRRFKVTYEMVDGVKMVKIHDSQTGERTEYDYENWSKDLRDFDPVSLIAHLLRVARRSTHHPV